MEIKSDIIEHLWKIIISDNSIDQYEVKFNEKNLWSYLFF